MNISPETLEALNNMYTVQFYDEFGNEKTPSEATEMYIGYEKLDGKLVDDDGYFINHVGKTLKAPKKEVTIDWIVSRINSVSVFKNFSEYFNKIISKYGLSAYPTTYGIGVFVAVGHHDTINATQKKIEDVLNKLNVQYTTGYSDAGWVFRYKISKSSTNIQHIKMLTDNTLGIHQDV